MKWLIVFYIYGAAFAALALVPATVEAFKKAYRRHKRVKAFYCLFCGIMLEILWPLLALYILAIMIISVIRWDGDTHDWYD